MGKPTGDFPFWATGGSADIVEPSAAKKALGWEAGETPPAQYFNYLQNAFGERLRAFLYGYGFGWVTETYKWKPVGIAVTGSAAAGYQDGWYYSLGANTEIDCYAPRANAVTGEAIHHVPLTWLAVLNAGTNEEAAFYMRHANGASTNQQVIAADGAVIIMEWSAYLRAVGSNGCHVGMGFHREPFGATDFHDETENAFFMFEKLATNTNWQARVSDAAASTDTDTGTAPTADTWQKFRIEYHGEDTTVGLANGFATVRFYINDALEEETYDANVPVTADNSGVGWALTPVFHVEGDGTGPTLDMGLSIGTVHLGYNELPLTDMPD